jgi:hypothetical protein
LPSSEPVYPQSQPVCPQTESLWGLADPLFTKADPKLSKADCLFGKKTRFIAKLIIFSSPLQLPERGNLGSYRPGGGENAQRKLFLHYFALGDTARNPAREVKIPSKATWFRA